MHREHHFLFILSFPKTPDLVLVAAYYRNMLFHSYCTEQGSRDDEMNVFNKSETHLTFRNPDSFYFRCNGKGHQISKYYENGFYFSPAQCSGPSWGN